MGFHNQGYRGQDGQTCTACAAGKYDPGTFSTECHQCPPGTQNPHEAGVGFNACQPCAPGTYNSSTNAACLSCPQNSSSFANSSQKTDCTCNQGYQGEHGQICVVCPVGKFDEGRQNTGCTTCPPGTSNPQQASVNITSCRNCEPGTYNSSNQSTCIACPYNSTSDRQSSSRSDCKCNAGFSGRNGGECTICEKGKYDAGPHVTVCTQCPTGMIIPTEGSVTINACSSCGVNTYTSTDQSVCNNCPLNSNSTTNSSQLSDCKCLPGFQYNEGGNTETYCSKCFSGNSPSPRRERRRTRMPLMNRS